MGLRFLLVAWCVGGSCAWLFAQTGRKPTRVERPSFKSGQFKDVFFPDAGKMLQGEPPPAATGTTSSSTSSTSPAPSASPADLREQAGGEVSWHALISPVSLEDLVKAAKLRLDKIVTTPSAFKGGGYQDAQIEFSLLAVMFAIIESYDGEVRWKSSAAAAREKFARVAANTKIGSDQVYQEAKIRLLDLSELIGGTPLADQARAPIDWSNLIDRSPLMALLDWAHQENLTKLVAVEAEFADNPDAVRRFAELIAVLGQVALAEDMPDSSDEDYAAFSKAMIGHARQVVAAVQVGNAGMARAAAAQLGQSCSNCHAEYQ